MCTINGKDIENCTVGEINDHLKKFKKDINIGACQMYCREEIRQKAQNKQHYYALMLKAYEASERCKIKNNQVIINWQTENPQRDPEKIKELVGKHLPKRLKKRIGV